VVELSHSSVHLRCSSATIGLAGSASSPSTGKCLQAVSFVQALAQPITPGVSGAVRRKAMVAWSAITAAEKHGRSSICAG
jgi:hypothetical protein